MAYGLSVVTASTPSTPELTPSAVAARTGGVAPEHAQVLIDPADVEAELADVFGGEGADLELDDDEAGLGPVEEEQVDVEVVAADLELLLPADEGGAVTEFEEEVL